jgi:hypothetical protein
MRAGLKGPISDDFVPDNGLNSIVTDPFYEIYICGCEFFERLLDVESPHLLIGTGNGVLELEHLD